MSLLASQVAEDAKDVEDRLGVFVTGFVNQVGAALCHVVNDGRHGQK